MVRFDTEIGEWCPYLGKRKTEGGHCWSRIRVSKSAEQSRAEQRRRERDESKMCMSYGGVRWALKYETHRFKLLYFIFKKNFLF